MEVIPGPSACVTALVLSGIPSDQFFFEGFLPRKHGERVRRLQRLASIPGALIFYESPYRAEASLKAIARCFRSVWSRSAASSPSCTRRSCAHLPRAA